MNDLVKTTNAEHQQFLKRLKKLEEKHKLEVKQRRLINEYIAKTFKIMYCVSNPYSFVCDVDTGYLNFIRIDRYYYVYVCYSLDFKKFQFNEKYDVFDENIESFDMLEF